MDLPTHVTGSGGDAVRESGLSTHGTGSGGDAVRESGLSTHGTDSDGDAVRKSGLSTHGTGSDGGAVRESGLSTHGMVASGTDRRSGKRVKGIKIPGGLEDRPGFLFITSKLYLRAKNSPLEPAGLSWKKLA